MVVSWHHGFMVLFHGTMIPHHGTTVPYHGHGTIPCHHGTIPWDSRDLSKWAFLGPVSIKHQHAENSKMNKKISWGVLFLSEKIIKNLSWGVFWEEYLSSKSRKEFVGDIFHVWKNEEQDSWGVSLICENIVGIFHIWNMNEKASWGRNFWSEKWSRRFRGEYFVFFVI